MNISDDTKCNEVDRSILFPSKMLKLLSLTTNGFIILNKKRRERKITVGMMPTAKRPMICVSLTESEGDPLLVPLFSPFFFLLFTYRFPAALVTNKIPW